jgi:hypothetical protein
MSVIVRPVELRTQNGFGACTIGEMEEYIKVLRGLGCNENTKIRYDFIRSTFIAALPIENSDDNTQPERVAGDDRRQPV